MTLEGKVKTFIDVRMKTWFPDAIKYSPPGVGRFGKNGFPDRLWFIGKPEYGITVAIEAKDDGKDTTSLQKKCLKDLSRVGVLCAVVRGRDEDKMNMIRKLILEKLK